MRQYNIAFINCVNLAIVKVSLYATIFLSFSIQALEPISLSIDDLIVKSRLTRIEGDFQQKNFLRNLRKPLVSSGRYTFDVCNKKLVWHIETPIVASIQLNKTEFAQTDAFGNTQRLSMDANPVIGMISQIFISLMSLDTIGLENFFTIDLSGTKQSWRITLHPKMGTLQKYFNRIELRGSTYIDQLTFDDAQGEKTQILFTHAAS